MKRISKGFTAEEEALIKRLYDAGTPDLEIAKRLTVGGRPTSKKSIQSKRFTRGWTKGLGGKMPARRGTTSDVRVALPDDKPVCGAKLQGLLARVRAQMNHEGVDTIRIDRTGKVDVTRQLAASFDV